MRQEGMNSYLNTNKLQFWELEAKVIMIVIDDQFAGTDKFPLWCSRFRQSSGVTDHLALNVIDLALPNSQDHNLG